MLIINGEPINNTDLKYFKDNNFEAYYTGFFFIPSFQNGEQTLLKIIEEINANNLDFIQDLYGTYFIAIKHTNQNKSYVFTDNSGLFKAFIHENIISTSFNELIEYSNSKYSINYESLVDFLHFGFVFFDNTLCKEISKLNPNFFYVINPDNSITKVNKNLSKIDGTPPIDPYVFFEHLHESIKKENISVDLTGGTDSRLIASALNHQKANFEIALSGVEGNNDIRIAKRISDIINKKFFFYIHSVDNMTNEKLEELFLFTDAQTDIVVYQRLFNFFKEREKRNVTMHFSGAGGELYKDFWWLQDFPRYNKKKANLSKLYNLRIESVAFNHDILNKSLQVTSKDTKSRTLRELEKLVLSSNSKTYDSIYYYYKMQIAAGTFLSISNRFFKSYAPFLELNLVKFGFNLPRSQRFYNNFQRDFITKNCKEISRIRTDTGISCSSSFLMKIGDIFYFGINMSVRLLKQILRKLLKKTLLQESPNNVKLYPNVRKLEIVDEAIDILKKHNILDENVTKDLINNNLLGKILTLGLFIKKHDKKLLR